MFAISDFAPNIRELLILVNQGPLLQLPYSANAKNENVVFDLNLALDMYMDQDIAKPFHFLNDITSTAIDDITENIYSNPLLNKLRKNIDGAYCYRAVCAYLLPYKNKLGLNKSKLETLANIISEDLYTCIKIRISSNNSHPYFEKMLQVYKDQGFPCAWRGGTTWKRGNFVVFSRQP